MKSIIFLLTFVLICSDSFATLRRVNNNPGITLPAFGYTTFVAAHTAAVNGDTIYIEPSNINYGALNLSKKLTVVGPGYLLDQNTGTPADKRSTTFSSGNFTLGANGSILTGLTFHDGNSYTSITLNNVANITITRCMLFGFSLVTSISDMLLSQNVILNNLIQSNNSFFSSNVFNNIVLGSISGISSGIVKNNLAYNVPLVDNNTNYFNNIFVGTGSNSDVLEGITAFHNVCVNCEGTASNNNFYTNAYNTIFIAAEPRIFDDFEDARFQLAVTSPAKTKGVGGVDCGPFGGSNPYILSGVPAYPSITAITVGAQVGSNLPVTISMKRNN